MIRKSIFDTPTTPRLYTFLQWVRDGQLFIPDFQRPFEWDDQRRLDLLDSVSRGLPIGAFMVWRTLYADLKTYPSLGPFALPQPLEGEARSYLIDGHQRLTTLFAALEPVEPETLESLQRSAGRWPVFFDLATEEKDPGFVLAPRRRGFEPPMTWLPTNELFSPKALWRRQRALEATGLERYAERTEELANAFKDYIVPVLPLVTDDLRAVTDSFVRVNSGGKPMSEDKVLRALVYVDYRIDEHIEQIRASLAEIGWGELKEQVFVNALKVRLQLDVYRSSSADVKRAVEARGPGTEAYRRVMDELREGLSAAALLLNQCFFSGPGVLPYQYQLIGLSEALLRSAGPDPAKLNAFVVNAELKGRVLHWLWATTYASYFTGMTGNRIRDAIDHLHEVLMGTASPLPKDLNRRIDRLETFHGTSTRSIALVLMMAGLQEDEAFRKQVDARLGEAGTKAVDRIFPQASDTIPGNRLVTTPDQLRALREALARDPSNLNEELARKHYIPPEALAILAADPSDHTRFLEVRTQYLEQLEAKLIRDLGLEIDI
jgi:Protein of unknown function DUF262